MTIVYLCLMQNTKIQRNLKEDGRRLRSLESKALIVDAMMKLINKGILDPTAQQVADEAGMGIRTVFRQIQDKETLFLLMDKKVKDFDDQGLMTTSPKGNLKSRIRDLIELKAKAYEGHLQFIRATLVNKWKYKTLQNNYEGSQRNIKLLLYRWLPELSELEDLIQIFLTSIHSTGYWIELRENQMLSVEEAIELKIQTFERVLL